MKGPESRPRPGMSLPHSQDIFPNERVGLGRSGHAGFSDGFFHRFRTGSYPSQEGQAEEDFSFVPPEFFAYGPAGGNFEEDEEKPESRRQRQESRAGPGVEKSPQGGEKNRNHTGPAP